MSDSPFVFSIPHCDHQGNTVYVRTSISREVGSQDRVALFTRDLRRAFGFEIPDEYTSVQLNYPHAPLTERAIGVDRLHDLLNGSPPGHLGVGAIRCWLRNYAMDFIRGIIKVIDEIEAQAEAEWQVMADLDCLRAAGRI